MSDTPATQKWQSARHNRPDGTPCDYIAGFVCNKCGTAVERRSGAERRTLETPWHLLREWKENERVGPWDRRRQSTVEGSVGEAVGGEGVGSSGSLVESAWRLVEAIEDTDVHLMNMQVALAFEEFRTELERAARHDEERAR